MLISTTPSIKHGIYIYIYIWIAEGGSDVITTQFTLRGKSYKMEDR